MTSSTDPVDELHQICFYVQRNIRYHMRRASFFMRWSRFTAFVSVVFGSAAATTVLTQMPSELTLALAVMVTLTSAVELVVGVSQRSWLHAELRKRYLEIDAEISAAGTPNDKSIRDIKSRIRKIEADEPPTLPALELLARNDVIRAMYPAEEAEKHLSHLNWMQRTFAHWYEWDTSKA